jgi:UDP-glucose 4-epimerase
MAKKILVTGGAGYIGAHTVVELMNAGFHPVIIDNLSKTDRTLLEGMEKITGKRPDFFLGDCSDRKLLNELFESKGPFASVLHFAAYKSVGESVQFPLMYYNNNIGSLLALLDVMKQHKVRDLIFSSSCTVYGQPDFIPVNEQTPFKRAESPYGATKQMSERILEDAHKTGYRIISLRYFNPIGAHPTAWIGELPIGVPNNLVPYVTQTAAGKRQKLTIFGGDYNTPDGTCIRDYIHVVDVAAAHVKAMEYLDTIAPGDLYDAFNLGTGIGVSVLQIVEEFKRITGVNLPYTIGPRRAGDVEKVYADPSKLNNSFHWKTKFSIADALLHAWQWENKLSALSQ